MQSIRSCKKYQACRFQSHQPEQRASTNYYSYNMSAATITRTVISFKLPNQGRIVSRRFMDTMKAYNSTTSTSTADEQNVLLETYGDNTDQPIKSLLSVAIIGSPNAGKSTLLNRLIGQHISCVSNKVHTTRENVLGFITEGHTQLRFLDSPGLVTKEHMLKHRLEHSAFYDAQKASSTCDLIAVLVDASNIREKKRLNKGIIKILNNHLDKESILMLNKVDLIKDKGELLEITSILTQEDVPKEAAKIERKKHKYVLELDQDKRPPPKETEPTGFKHFSRLFYISALRDDGVDSLRDYMLTRAKPVNEWPRGPNYLTNQSTNDLVHNIIRGKVMDKVQKALPYVLQVKVSSNYDDMGSLHVKAKIGCPKKHMIGLVIGEGGRTISEITAESRELICRNMFCDVKLVVDVALAGC